MSSQFLIDIEKILYTMGGSPEGYSDEEIRKIEAIYCIYIHGEFRDFLRIAGKTDGGIMGNDPIFLYDSRLTIHGHMTFQMAFFSKMQDIEAWEYLRHSFLFSIENETQYYFLITEDKGSLVYHYNENEGTVSCSNKTFSEYILGVFNYYGKDTLKRPIVKNYRGGLLRIYDNVFA